MSHPLSQDSGGSLSSSPQSLVSKIKPSASNNDSTGIKIQVPVIKDLDHAHGLDGGNVLNDPAVDNSVSLPEEVIDSVSSVQKHHDNPCAATENENDDKSIYGHKIEVFEDVYEDFISQCECPESASSEKSGENEEEVAEAPSDGDVYEVSARIDVSFDEVFDKVSTVQTHVHDNSFVAAGNDDKSPIYVNNTAVFEDVKKDIISRVYEEELGECSKSGSFEEKSCEEDGEMAEVPSEGEDEYEAPAQGDVSVDEDEYPGMCAY